MKTVILSDFKIIIKRFLLITIPMMILGFIFSSYLSISELEKSKSIALEGQKQRASTMTYIIEHEFKELYENVKIVSNSSEIKMFANSQTKHAIEEMTQMMYNLASSKKDLLEIKVIDIKGSEIASIKRVKDEVEIEEEYELSNIANEEFFKKAININLDEIYISDMTLYSDNDSLVLPYQPVLYVATPIYNGEIMVGILKITYSVNDIISALDQQSNDLNQGFIKPILANQDSYYLYGIKYDENFGFLFNGRENYNLKSNNIELWNKMQEQESGVYYSEDLSSYYSKIDLFLMIDGNINQEFSWYIIYEYNISDLPASEGIIFLGIGWIDLIAGLGIMILIFLILVGDYYSKKNKEELGVLQKIAENINEAIVITDKHTKILYVNNSFENITGFSKEEVLGLKTNSFKSGKHSKQFYLDMWDDIDNKGSWNGVLWDKRKDGLLYPKKLNIYSLKDKRNRNTKRYIGLFSDLTDHLENQNYVEKMKGENTKTKLPNESLVDVLIDNLIEKEPKKLYVIYFTIENYIELLIEFNNNYESFIDPLIFQLKSILEEDDFVAQIYKKDFIMGVSSEKNIQDFNSFIQQFINLTGSIFTFNIEEELYYDVRVGISSYPSDGENPQELLSNANIALRKSIETPGNKYTYYMSHQREVKEKETKIITHLRKALENEELYILYQPQIDIINKKVVGMEALLRWENKEVGNIPPNIFIEMAEREGLILQIGYWIIEEVFKDYSKNREKFSGEYRTSINISPVQFMDSLLLKKIVSLGEKYEVDFSNFEIEVTESVFMSNLKEVNEKFKEFKAMGISVAIDDFGTAFSSLSYLKELNIDKLKIDRSFIKDYPQKDKGEIAELIAEISKKLNLKVITEGVETLEQLEFMKQIGCDLVQGFYYSRPINIDKLIYFIENYKI